mmetsp:Transcript_37466/g.27619  ORF Transcript_37466/g.27619 Transcript_37466/m.27619 type:complete len:168 (-) Transcript_37466:105-608(-)
MQACCLVQEFVIRKMMLPGQIESWIVLIDFGKLSLFQIPYKNLKGIIGMLQSQYRCRSAKIFILNISTAFSVIWNTVKGFIEEHTKKKMTITKQHTDAEMWEYFHPLQVPVRYGGEGADRPAVWPPRIQSLHNGFDPEKQMNRHDFIQFSKTNKYMQRRFGVEELYP